MEPRPGKTRQKNCNSCVQAKRRCDRLTVCSRCMDKSLLCMYGGEALLADALQSAEFMLPELPPTIGDYSAEMAWSGELEQQYPEAGITLLPQTLLQSPPRVPCFEDGQTDLNMALTTLPTDRTHTAIARNAITPSTDDDTTLKRPGTPADAASFRTYDAMTSICTTPQPWQVHDPTSTLSHLLSTLKSLIRTLACTSAAPFLHPALYRTQTPPCMLSCYSTCVLYHNRTPQNAAMVVRVLCGNVAELLGRDKEQDRGDGGSEPGRLAPLERLARTQSLLVYQIVRLLDGDVMLRARGEGELEVLRGWVGELCGVRDNLGGGLEAEDWRVWVFAESLRRTVVLAYSFMGIYAMMKGELSKADPGPWAYIHRWTMSRPLWEAESATVFAQRWRERPPWIIENYSLEKFVSHGRGRDVDEFGELLLSAYMGVEATKNFLAQDQGR